MHDDDEHEHGHDCDCPSNQELRQMIADNIKEHGRQVLSITGEEPFCYSIGNSLYGHPELLVVGLPGVFPGHVINSLSDEAVKLGKPWKAGTVHRPEWITNQTLVVKFVAPAPTVRDDFTIQAGQFLQNETYPVLQAVLSDAAGKFPGDPGCHEAFAAQRVIGLN